MALYVLSINIFDHGGGGVGRGGVFIGRLGKGGWGDTLSVSASDMLDRFLSIT